MAIFNSNTATEKVNLSFVHRVNRKPFFSPVPVQSNQTSYQYNQPEQPTGMSYQGQQDPFFKPATLSNSTIQRKCAAYEATEKKLQRKASSEENTLTDITLQNYTDSLSSQGQPLPDSTRQFFEPRFSQDFSKLRIHNDSKAASSAQSIHAKAYTTGNHIVFNQGQYTPESESGKSLLAHELTHVVQQAAGGENTIQRAATASATPPAHPVLGIGSSGPSVVLLQNQLNQSGANPPLNPDGQFGPATRNAVVQYQSANGLVADGVVGEKTWSILLTGQKVPVDEPGIPESTGSAEALGFEPANIGSGDKAKTGPIEDLSDGPGFEPASFGNKAKTGSDTNNSSNACPPYSNAELEASNASGGEFDSDLSIGPTTTSQSLAFDFIPGSNSIRPKHSAGIAKMIEDLGLRDQKPKAVVQNIVGFTDCIASENINNSLRQERAVAILTEFILSGALTQNLPSESNVRGANANGEADQLPGTDSTIEGKTKNRSVLIVALDEPIDDVNPPKKPSEEPAEECNALTDSSKEWSLKVLSEASMVGGAGFAHLTFRLRNETSGCEYLCDFLGFGGGIAAGISLDAGGYEKFETPDQSVVANDFECDNQCTEVFSAGIGFGVSISHAYIRFKKIKTVATNIDIGGLSLGLEKPGFTYGILGAEGRVRVRNKGSK